MFPDVRPQLIVFASQVLTRNFSEVLAFVRDSGNANVWIIDKESALAIRDHDGRNVCVDGFAPGDSRVRPLDLLLNNVTNPESFGIYGSFPSSRFFVGFVFPKGEEPYRMVTSCKMMRSEPLRLRLHTYKDLGDAGFAKVRNIFSNWFQEAKCVGFHGEVLECPEISFTRYSEPARYPLPRQLGWEIIMPQANEVFFPWLELFFSLRRQLPKKMRVSLEFTHPLNDTLDLV